MRAGSKRKFESYRGIDKGIMQDLIFKKIKGIEKKHILPVLNIMLDLMLEDLFEGKEIKINNFITINLSTIASKRARNYYTGEMIDTKPYNRLSIKLSKKFSNFIKKNLDKEFYDQKK